jgi:Tfp pilus assembly protein PilV
MREERVFPAALLKNVRSLLKSKYFFRGQGGFALIEVLLSVMLIALTIVPLMTLTSYGNKYKVESNVELVAFNLARQKAEYYMKNPVQLSGLPLAENGAVDLANQFFGSDYADYTCNISSKVNAYSINNFSTQLETITIKVYYRDPLHQKPPVVTLASEVVRPKE